MDYMSILKETKDSLLFQEDALHRLATAHEGVKYGIITVLLAGIAAGLGTLNIFTVVIAPIFMLIGVAIAVGINHVLAKLFKGEATYSELFSVFANAHAIYWATIIPFVNVILTPLIGIYLFVYSIYAIHKTYSLDLWKAVVIALIPPVLFGVLLFILAIVFGALFGGTILAALLNA